MSRPKLVTRIVVAVIIVILIPTGVLYYLAGLMPDDYRPVKLSQEAKERVVSRFVQHVVLDFRNSAQRLKPFTWRITQRQINEYLASMDQIAAGCPEHSSGEIDAKMQEMGLGDPAVAIGDGKVTLMIRSTRFGNVLSADIAADLTEDGKLRITLAGTRVGKLSVPRGPILRPLKNLRRQLVLRRSLDRNGPGLEVASPEAVGGILAALIAAIDGKPIVPEETWTIKGIGIRIEDLTIDDEKREMAIRIRPIAPSRPR